MNKIIIALLTMTLLISAAVNIRQYRKQSASSAEFIHMLKKVAAAENIISGSFPAYEDYPDASRIEKRKYDYSAHIASAVKNGFLVRNETEASELISAKKLVSIDGGRYYYFYGVPVSNRYLTPSASSLLNIVGERFIGKLRTKGFSGSARFAVSSALRWSDYQTELMKNNPNAISGSTHRYGVSFDIFFDDYSIFPDFVFVENAAHARSIQSSISFLAGDSLRRQLKSVMAECLSELQDEGALYFIFEKNQRCFHVTVR